MIKRPLLTLGLPFLITMFGLSYMPPIIVCVILTIGVMSNFLAYKNKTMLVIIIISIVFAFLIFQNYQSNMLFDTSVFSGARGHVTAKVIDKSITSSGGNGYTIEILDNDIENLPIGFKGILYSNSDVFVDYYDVIDIYVTCNHITSTEGFDFATYYKSNGISMQFFSYADPKIVKSENTSFLYKIKKLNENLCNIFDKSFPIRYSGMLKAMLLGDDSDLDDILYKNASFAGLSHIFVVSGLHIGLIVGLIAKILSLFDVNIKLCNIFCIIITWVFVLLTGFGIPGIRAGVMMTMLLFSRIIYRENDALNTLFATGFIMITLAPYTIMSLSFQLSFSAVLGIVLFSKKIEKQFIIIIKQQLENDTLPKWIKVIISGMSITISSSIGMLPISFLVFKGVSIITIIANLVVTPMLPLLLMLGILFLIFSFIPPIANTIYIPLLFMLFLIKNLTEFFAGFKFSYLGLDYDWIYLYIISAIVISFILLLFKYTKIKYHFKAISIITVIFVISNYILNYNVLTFTIFNNSDGNTIVVSDIKKTTLINFEDSNRNDIDVTTYLKSKNINTIENYVNFNINSSKVDDFMFLSEFIKINRLVFSPYDYISDYINIKNSIKIKQESVRIYSNKNNYLDMFYGDLGSCILGEISGDTVLITDSLGIANNFEYDILITNKNEDIITKYNKQIIFVDEETSERKTLTFKL